MLGQKVVAMQAEIREQRQIFKQELDTLTAALQERQVSAKEREKLFEKQLQSMSIELQTAKEINRNSRDSTEDVK